MPELTKEDIKEAVRDAMAEKFEMTLGIDCRSPEERAETRKDLEFLRNLRMGANRGAEKVLYWIVGVFGSAAIAYFWPDIAKHIGK